MTIRMKTLEDAIAGIVAMLILCAVLGSLITLCTACGNSAQVATPAAAEANYTAQQLKCIDDATTREESRACRAEVDRKWGVDSGAAKEGGK